MPFSELGRVRGGGVGGRGRGFTMTITLSSKCCMISRCASTYLVICVWWVSCVAVCRLLCRFFKKNCFCAGCCMLSGEQSFSFVVYFCCLFCFRLNNLVWSCLEWCVIVCVFFFLLLVRDYLTPYHLRSRRTSEHPDMWGGRETRIEGGIGGRGCVGR